MCCRNYPVETQSTVEFIGLAVWIQGLSGGCSQRCVAVLSLCVDSVIQEEDKRLLEIARKHNGYNWEAIAAELGTRRSPMMCFKRYQRSLNTDLLRRCVRVCPVMAITDVSVSFWHVQ